MPKHTPDPRKKYWAVTVPPAPKKKTTTFFPLGDSALKTVPNSVIVNRLKQLKEVEDSLKAWKLVSHTSFGKGMGIRPPVRQLEDLQHQRSRMVNELAERRRKK